MPDEIMKYFLEQMIESTENIINALNCALQYYDVNVTEKEYQNTINLSEKEEL